MTGTGTLVRIGGPEAHVALSNTLRSRLRLRLIRDIDSYIFGAFAHRCCLCKLRGEEASQWRAHFATCSPCTREYASFRQEFQRAKRLQARGAIAAVVVLAVM